jgi:hypothetical protein
MLLGEFIFLLEHAHGNHNLVCINPHVESLIYCTNYQGLIHCDYIWFLSLLCVNIDFIFLSPLSLLQVASVVFPSHNYVLDCGLILHGIISIIVRDYSLLLQVYRSYWTTHREICIKKLLQ